ncbi:MAG: hypothetical protein OXS30_07635 [Chloroflexota bacterium]|nr:hypothetical protein [Chloroflexota bacterium]
MPQVWQGRYSQIVIPVLRQLAGALLMSFAVAALVGVACRDSDQGQENAGETEFATAAGSTDVAELPEYLSGEGVSWIEQWPYIQTAGLCGEEAHSDFEEVPRPGHGLTSRTEPTAALREASSMLGLEWDDWERRWFDRDGVTLYRRSPWQGQSGEYAGASLYLVYQGEPPRWDEAQSSLLYACEGESGEARPLPPPLYIELDGERVDVRYGAVLALLNPTHLPGVDLERSCSWFHPGFVDHRSGRRQARPHGLSEGAVAASDLPESLLTAVIEYGHERPLDEFDYLWVTEHRVMAFARTPREGGRYSLLGEVREFGLIDDDGQEEWVELAHGVVWECGG